MAGRLAAPADGTVPAARRGRRDPEGSRDALLRAARAEFVRHGFAGARVDKIAAAAGVNKQLVYHHFGDKDALYLAVLETIYGEIRTREASLHLAGLSPDRAIRRLIEFSFDYLADSPEFVALLSDENRLGAAHVRRSAKLPAMHSPLVELLAETIASGVSQGLFRPGLDPMQLYISIAGLSYFYFSNTATLSAIFARELRSGAALKRRRQHVVDFVMTALRP